MKFTAEELSIFVECLDEAKYNWFKILRDSTAHCNQEDGFECRLLALATLEKIISLKDKTKFAWYQQCEDEGI